MTPKLLTDLYLFLADRPINAEEHTFRLTTEDVQELLVYIKDMEEDFFIV